MRDVTVGQVAEAVVTVDFFYEEGDAGTFPPVVRDVEVRNVTSRRRAGTRCCCAATPTTRSATCASSTARSTASTKPDVLEGVKDLVLTNMKIKGQLRNGKISR